MLVILECSVPQGNSIWEVEEFVGMGSLERGGIGSHLFDLRNRFPSSLEGRPFLRMFWDLWVVL